MNRKIGRQDKTALLLSHDLSRFTDVTDTRLDLEDETIVREYMEDEKKYARRDNLFMTK